MIKTMVGFILLLACLFSCRRSLPPRGNTGLASSHQPDGMIMQSPSGLRSGYGHRRNGACVARTTMRHARRCARWNGGVCAHYY